MSEITDPRDVPGDIAGPGGSHSRNSVVLDASRAVLLDYQEVAFAEFRPTDGSDDGECVALLMSGRINKSQDRARVLFVFNEDGAAALVTELEALMHRAGGKHLGEYMRNKFERRAKLREEGNR
jgi:hypothetical protein